MPKQINIIRRPEMLRRNQCSNSTLHNRIHEGCIPPPISLGDRAVGWIEHEVDCVIEAMVAGESKGRIRTLVKKLIEERQERPLTTGLI